MLRSPSRIDRSRSARKILARGPIGGSGTRRHVQPADWNRSAASLGGLRLGVGIENLTDADPPIFPSRVEANTDPSQYDVFGRRCYVSLRYFF
jgi:hypothetical protein